MSGFTVEVLPSETVAITAGPGDSEFLLDAGPSGSEIVLDVSASGPAGQAGISFVHRQDTAATVWMINHNLNAFPSVTVADSAGTVVVGDVQYLTANTIEIRFDAAFGGVAYLN